MPEGPSSIEEGPPRLSIVVPTLDEAACIAACLEPLQRLRGRVAEIIVVDGGSRDGTPARATPVADRVVSAPRGRAAQMNAGAALARGELLLFLHADCRLSPEAALEALERCRGGRRWGRFDVTLRGRPRTLRLVGALMNLRSRWTGIATGDQGLFVRREDFAAIGGFPPIALMEDIELSRRLKRRGRPLCLAHRIEASGRRWERAGAWRTIALMWRLRLAYFLGADPERLARDYRRAAR